jgi:prepilin-type N-terminal cleavage/methylation domain-containing protein
MSEVRGQKSELSAAASWRSVGAWRCRLAVLPSAFCPWPSARGPRRRRRCRRAFTLIELMVVIVLIGILVGILLPAFSKMKERSLIRRAETETRMLATAIRDYHHEYGYWPNENLNDPNLVIIRNSTNFLFMRIFAADAPSPHNDHHINFLEIPGYTNADPFRRSLAYLITINVTNNTVSVRSYGPDCSNGVDDIEAIY